LNKDPISGIANIERNWIKGGGLLYGKRWSFVKFQRLKEEETKKERVI